MNRESKRQIFAILVLFIFLGSGIAFAFLSSLPGTGINSSTLTIDGIECSSSEQTVYHIHSHLDIFINGQRYAIPANTGIVGDTCLYWLHTHDDTGVIHIESPSQKTYTIGQFFDIWNRTFSNTQIFGNVVNENNTLNMYVNGQRVGGNYRDIVLSAHEEIAIVYGTPPSTIPSSYNFAPGE